MSTQFISYIVSLFVSANLSVVAPIQQLAENQVLTQQVSQAETLPETRVADLTQKETETLDNYEADLSQLEGNFPEAAANFYEPNNTKKEAIAIESTVQSNISGSTDVDLYRIDYKANTIIEISVDNEVDMEVEHGNSNEFHVYHLGRTAYATYASQSNDTIYVKLTGDSQEYTLRVQHKQSATMNVKSILQEQSQWCWAASSQIVANVMKNYGFAVKDISQAEIVREIHGNLNNTPAKNIGETRDALGYAISSSGNNTRGFKGVLSEEQLLKNIVVEKEPVVMRVGNGESNGHFVVITGVEIQGNQMFLYVQDPLVVNTIKVSYNDAIRNGYKPNDGRTWNYTVEIL